MLSDADTYGVCVASYPSIVAALLLIIMPPLFACMMR
jgi:hypothetical protein